MKERENYTTNNTHKNKEIITMGKNHTNGA